MTFPKDPQIDERDEQISDEHAIRIEKLKAMQEQGMQPWPQTKSITATTVQIKQEFEATGHESKSYAIAGRVLSLRFHGKTAFVDLQDRKGKLQLYVRQDELGEQQFEQFKSFVDIGDIVWVQGASFLTKMGEITLKVNDYSLLSKSLRPLPEKFHGLADVETKYRQRYLDLISNPESRERFIKRSHIIRAMRAFFDSRDFIEVETPMLHTIPGGAEARPFVTHHNALDIDLYLRIAPELFLKRLTIGGLERVYEINRCFRNEGISTKHNPEFTSVECYIAYYDYNWMMDFVEEMIRYIAQNVCHAQQLPFGDYTIDYGAPFKRVTMTQAVMDHLKCSAKDLEQNIDALITKNSLKMVEGLRWGEKLYLLFDKLVEPTLIQPTFITQFPVEVSPLAKKNPQDSRFVDRFEMFIAGMELCNGFTELNDPFDQAERFHEQMKKREKGDEEAHSFDADYVRSLEYGLPPTVGAGIGVDRLTMFLTNAHSIRDVILFPTLRPKNIE